jgi:chromosome segregation ATPase
MKHTLRTLSLLALMAHAVPLAALAPADIARLEQEVRAAITAEDFLIAQDLIARLEGAGARATAQPLMVQLSKALEKRAIGAAELQRQYRNLEARELKPLRRLRQELEARVKQLESDLTRARDFGYQQRDKVDALQRQFNSLEQKAQNISNELAAEQNQREQAETAFIELQKKAANQEIKTKQLEEQLRLKQDALNDLTAKFSRVETNLRDLTKERNEILDKYAESLEKITKLEAENSKLKKENELLIEKATDLGVENEDLKNERTALNNAIKEVSRLTQQNANQAARMSVTELQTAISEIADAVKSLL